MYYNNIYHKYHNQINVILPKSFCWPFSLKTRKMKSTAILVIVVVVVQHSSHWSHAAQELQKRARKRRSNRGRGSITDDPLRFSLVFFLFAIFRCCCCCCCVFCHRSWLEIEVCKRPVWAGTISKTRFLGRRFFISIGSATPPPLLQLTIALAVDCNFSLSFLCLLAPPACPGMCMVRVHTSNACTDSMVIIKLRSNSKITAKSVQTFCVKHLICRANVWQAEILLFSLSLSFFYAASQATPSGSANLVYWKGTIKLIACVAKGSWYI